MSKSIEIFRQPARFLAMLALAAGLGFATIALPGFSGVALAQGAGEVPGDSLGAVSDAEFWRAVREGQEFTVSIPDKQAGVMIQSEGETWRNYRNGPVTNFGGWVIVGMIIVLAVFYGLRGRIRIDSGLSSTSSSRIILARST